MAHAGQPYKDFRDVLAAARAKPGAVSFGSIGTGSLGHLAMAQVGNQLGLEFNHIPYNGAGPLRTAVLGDQVVIGGMNLGEVMPFREKVRIIAQASPANPPPDACGAESLGVKRSAVLGTSSTPLRSTARMLAVAVIPGRSDRSWLSTSSVAV